MELEGVDMHSLSEKEMEDMQTSLSVIWASEWEYQMSGIPTLHSCIVAFSKEFVLVAQWLQNQVNYYLSSRDVTKYEQSLL